MRRTARDSLGPLGVIALIAGLSAAAPAFGEEVEVCRLVSSQGASFLEHCGDRLCKRAKRTGLQAVGPVLKSIRLEQQDRKHARAKRQEHGPD